jgi:hypothetical protein
MIGSLFPQGDLFSQICYQLLLRWVLGGEPLLEFADALLSEFDDHLVTDALLLIGFKGLLQPFRLGLAFGEFLVIVLLLIAQGLQVGRK